MYAAIFIPDFSLQGVLRSEPELSSQPVALVDPGWPRSGILQLTPSARSAGVREGQTPSQATARCGTLKIKARSFPQEEIASQLLLQTAFSFSPRVEATASGICTMDLQGLSLSLQLSNSQTLNSQTPLSPSDSPTHPLTHSQLPSPPPDPQPSTVSEKWSTNLLRQLAQFHLSARIGIASTPSLALLAARHAQPTLILDDPASFVGALPIAVLEPELEIAEILNLWGIRTVGQFLALGKEQVVERLGPAALNLFNRAALDSIRPLKLALQPEVFVEQIEFENEIETLAPLLTALRQFVEQLAARLGNLHLVIGELDLRLGLSSGVEHRERFKIPVPTGDVKILCRLVHTRLENVRTDAAINSCRLEARPAPSDANQLGLFVTTLVNPNQFAETLGRLSSLCGGERVGIPAAEPTLRPDAFRMNKPALTEETDLFADTHHAPDNQLGLQLRRFRPPLAAKIDFHNERPAVFRSSSFGGTITDTRGPFVTSGEWWDQNAWSRAEWDVQTADGMLYRLVRTPDGDFVEGVYD